jgi:beta-glucosidase
VTVLDGIRAAFPDAKVLYEKGAFIESGEEANFTAGIEAAKSADLVIVVVGDRLVYYGEGKSTAHVTFMGNQIDFLNALVALKKPLVIDVVASKPLIFPQEIVAGASAVIAQFSPGMLGGTAFAEALTGDINPSGKLTISIPAHVGQIPVYYNLVRGQHGDRYADLDEQPMWAFGHGLSYSRYQYAEGSLDKSVYSRDDNITATITIRNHGPLDGTEIVQVYLFDVVASVTWPLQELKAYQRVDIKNGESKQISITIRAADCSIVTADGKRIVEAGDFEFRVGQASDSIALKLPFTIQ